MFYVVFMFDIMFVMDFGVIEIGSFLVYFFDFRWGLDRDILVSMYFGGMEVIVMVWDVISGKRV